MAETQIDLPETMHIEAPVIEAPKPEPMEREAEGGVIETVERQPTAREVAMEAIVKNREKAIAKELQRVPPARTSATITAACSFLILAP